jgi:hypothetical protein
MWGDVPSWIAVAFDILIPLGALGFGFLKRNALGAWLSRSFTSTPPVPVTPAWEVARVGKNTVSLTNAAMPDADVSAQPPRQVRIVPFDGSVHLSGAAWASIDWGTTVQFTFDAWSDYPSEECGVYWMIVDKTEASGWREVTTEIKLPLNRI